MHLFRRRASVRRSKKRPHLLAYRGFTLPGLSRKRRKKEEEAALAAAKEAMLPPPPVPPERRKKRLLREQQEHQPDAVADGTLWPLPTQVHPDYPSTMLKRYREEYRTTLLGLGSRLGRAEARPTSSQAVFYAPTPKPEPAQEPPRPRAASPASSSPRASPGPSPSPSPDSGAYLSRRERFMRSSRSRPRAHRRWSTTESVLKFRGVPRPTLIRRARSGQGRQDRDDVREKSPPGPPSTATLPAGLGLGLGLGLWGLASSSSSSGSAAACSCACSCCSCCSRCPCEPGEGDDGDGSEEDIRPLVWPVSRLMAQRHGHGEDIRFPPLRPACRKDPALRQRAPPERLDGRPTSPCSPPSAPTPAPRLSLAGLGAEPNGVSCRSASPSPNAAPSPAPPPPDAAAYSHQVVLRRPAAAGGRERPVPSKRYSLSDLAADRPQPTTRHSLHLPDDVDIAAWAWPRAPAPTNASPAGRRTSNARHSMIELGCSAADDGKPTSPASSDTEAERGEPPGRPSTRVLPLWSLNKYSTIARIRVPASSPPAADERRTQTMGRRRPPLRGREQADYSDPEAWRRPLSPPMPPPASAKPRIAQPSPASTVLRVAQQQAQQAVPVAAVEPQRRTTAIGISMAPGQRATTRITEVQQAGSSRVGAGPRPRLAAKPPPCPPRTATPGSEAAPALPPRPKGMAALRAASPSPAPLSPPPSSSASSAGRPRIVGAVLKARSRSAERAQPLPALPPQRQSCADLRLPWRHGKVLT